MHVTGKVALQDASHQTCSNLGCRITCLADLGLHLKLYLDELDRVFFYKDNQRKKISWWLSAFYSLIIQGFVRRALMDILSTQLTGRDFQGVTQYLHLAVRLFIAISSNFDPIVQDSSSEPAPSTKNNQEETPDANYGSARIAVRWLEWETMGIASSAEYLRKLFEDVGDVIVEK